MQICLLYHFCRLDYAEGVYKTKAMKWLLTVQGLFLFLTSALTQGKLNDCSPCIDTAYYVQDFVVHIPISGVNSASIKKFYYVIHTA